MQIWALPANLTCIYTTPVFGRSPSNDFHALFSVSPFHYSEKIRCICSAHDLVFWYADAQPRLSRGISVATALTNAVTMYSLLSENHIRLKIGTRSKKQNTAINLLTVSALSSVFLLCARQGKEAGNAREHPETDSWVTEHGGHGWR